MGKEGDYGWMEEPQLGLVLEGNQVGGEVELQESQVWSVSLCHSAVVFYHPLQSKVDCICIFQCLSFHLRLADPC